MAKEYIEREAAKNAIFEYICGHTMSKFPSKELLIASKRGAEGAFNELDYIPTADVVEVKHGRKVESAISNTGLMCTACFSDIDRDAVFCKYCGAKMDGGNK